MKKLKCVAWQGACFTVSKTYDYDNINNRIQDNFKHWIDYNDDVFKALGNNPVFTEVKSRLTYADWENIYVKKTT
jgi:hypothetical protein